MTRLALIFSLLFVTPAWAESKAMECPPGRLIYKYETGFWGDRCYSRMAGRWKDNGNWTATDWSCTTPSLVVDFVEKTQTLIVGSKNFVEYCQEIELPD